MMPAKVYTERAGDVGLLGGATSAPALYYFLTDATLDAWTFKGRDALAVTCEEGEILYYRSLVTGRGSYMARDLPRLMSWDLTRSEERARRHLENA